MGLCGRAGGGVPPAQYGAGRPGMGAGTGAALGVGEMMGHSGGGAPRGPLCPGCAPLR